MDESGGSNEDDNFYHQLPKLNDSNERIPITISDVLNVENTNNLTISGDGSFLNRSRSIKRNHKKDDDLLNSQLSRLSLSGPSHPESSTMEESITSDPAERVGHTSQSTLLPLPVSNEDYYLPLPSDGNADIEQNPLPPDNSTNVMQNSLTFSSSSYPHEDDSLNQHLELHHHNQPNVYIDNTEIPQPPPIPKNNTVNQFSTNTVIDIQIQPFQQQQLQQQQYQDIIQNTQPQYVDMNDESSLSNPFISSDTGIAEPPPLHQQQLHQDIDIAQPSVTQPPPPSSPSSPSSTQQQPPPPLSIPKKTRSKPNPQPLPEIPLPPSIEDVNISDYGIKDDNGCSKEDIYNYIKLSHEEVKCNRCEKIIKKINSFGKPDGKYYVCIPCSIIEIEDKNVKNHDWEDGYRKRSKNKRNGSETPPVTGYRECGRMKHFKPGHSFIERNKQKGKDKNIVQKNKFALKTEKQCLYCRNFKKRQNMIKKMKREGESYESVAKEYYDELENIDEDDDDDDDDDDDKYEEDDDEEDA